jgi:hypothetical protein
MSRFAARAEQHGRRVHLQIPSAFANSNVPGQDAKDFAVTRRHRLGQVFSDAFDDFAGAGTLSCAFPATRSCSPVATAPFRTATRS